MRSKIIHIVNIVISLCSTIEFFRYTPLQTRTFTWACIMPQTYTMTRVTYDGGKMRGLIPFDWLLYSTKFKVRTSKVQNCRQFEFYI